MFVPLKNHRRDGVRVAVLIPSRGRPDILKRTIQKQPWLNSPDTFVGIEAPEMELYDKECFRRLGFKGTPVFYDNPDRSIGLARERLRAAAVAVGYDYYVATDDNARFTEEAFAALIRAAAEFPVQPCMVAGFHSFMKFTKFNRTLPDRKTINGLESFECVAAILTAVPHEVYSQYRYPDDAYALEDRHFVMWCLERGWTQWRVCIQAKYNKPRYQRGGSGSIEERQLRTGLSIARLATDFPKMMGISGAIRTPWQQLLQFARGKNFKTRPALGSIRRETDLLDEMA